MPDVKEVYEMVTKQRPPDAGALERQRTRQVRTMRNRRAGAFVVAAAIGVAAVAVILGTRGGSEPRTPLGERPTVSPMEVATGFIEAYGSLDVERTISHLADNADVFPLIGWVGTGVEEPPEGFQLLFSLLDAQGYKQTLGSCEEVGSSASVTSLRCTYDFHSLRSDEIGRGPYSGSYFDLLVRDGEIVRASGYMEIEKFGPQMWDPFGHWVSTNHPEDVAVMYEDETQSLERVTEESIRLWERHAKEYVADVKQGGAGQ